MAHILADRVLESSVSSGTGVFTLAGAVLGFRPLSAVCAVLDTIPYYIEAVDTQGRPTGEWEYGLGTYSAANQLTRTTVRGSSNAGLAVAFSAGQKLVGLGVAAPNSAATRLEWRVALGFASGGDALLGIGQGGTGQTSAAAAFNALKQAATELVSGVVELASDAEAQAFTAEKAIDGAKLNTALKGANQSLGTSGYQRLPGGLIIQWGRAVLTASGQTFTLPLAFPNTFAVVVPVQVQAGGPVLTANNVASANITSLSQFTIATNTASTLYYIAIGY